MAASHANIHVVGTSAFNVPLPTPLAPRNATRRKGEMDGTLTFALPRKRHAACLRLAVR